MDLLDSERSCWGICRFPTGLHARGPDDFKHRLPAGADHLDVAFDYLEPGTSATDKLLVIEWNQDVLYPAGPLVSKIIFKPTLILPVGWKFGTPEHVESQSGNQVSFAAVALDRLVDSPVITGQYYRAIDITPPGEPIHHEIDIVADSEAALEMSPETQKGMRNLVAEAGKPRMVEFDVLMSGEIPGCLGRIVPIRG